MSGVTYGYDGNGCDGGHDGLEPHEGSERQRRRRRRARLVAVLVAVAMLLPMVIATVDAVGG